MSGKGSKPIPKEDSGNMEHLFEVNEQIALAIKQRLISKSLAIPVSYRQAPRRLSDPGSDDDKAREEAEV